MQQPFLILVNYFDSTRGLRPIRRPNIIDEIFDPGVYEILPPRAKNIKLLETDVHQRHLQYFKDVKYLLNEIDHNLVICVVY